MKELIVTYFWHLLALGASPLAGFMWAQFYKISQSNKPSAIRVIIVNGGVTAIFAFMLWPGLLSEKAKIAATVGSVWPVLVFVWFVVAKKFAPAQYESLTGNGEDLTIMPGLKVKRKQKPDDPETGDDIGLIDRVKEDETQPRV